MCPAHVAKSHFTDIAVSGRFPYSYAYRATQTAMKKASRHARIAQLVEHQYKKCVTFPSPSCANSYVKRELIVVGSSPTPCNKLLSVVTKKEVRQTNVEYGFACLLFLAVCHYLDPDNLQYGENLVRRQP